MEPCSRPVQLEQMRVPDHNTAATSHCSSLPDQGLEIEREAYELEFALHKAQIHLWKMVLDRSQTSLCLTFGNRRTHLSAVV